MTKRLNHSLPLLLVEDDMALRQALSETLTLEGVEHLAVGSAEEAHARFNEQQWFAVVTDIRLPKQSGLDLLASLRVEHPELPVILMTAFADTSIAVQALRGGARDFLMKPFQPEHLIEVIQRYIPGDVTPESSSVGPIAYDELSKQLLSRIERVALTDATVLLLGESGSGKEVMARHLHNRSHRASKPFVALNCAAIPSSLLEPTLFGHEKGSFTGAVKSQAGKFELAQKGTIFLDEIGELPLDLQAKLLRVLQEREVERVGSNQTIDLDVRIVAATNQDLSSRVEQGLFRKDLFYRINVFTLKIPALRDRQGDIVPLAERFLLKYRATMGYPEARLSDNARKHLSGYAWPGNVRELENAVQRGLLMCNGRYIEAADLDLPTDGMANTSPTAATTPPPKQATEPFPTKETESSLDSQHHLRSIERDHILSVLRQVNGSRQQAVSILGMSERTLRHKLKAWREAGFEIP